MPLSLRKSIVFLFACALTLAVSACGSEDKKTAKDVPSDAIALVGETTVPRAEFDALMARAEKNYKAQKRPFPKVGSPEYQDLKTRAVSYLIQRYQFRAEAKELGIDVSDEDVEKKLEEIKKNGFQGSEEKFQAALRREGLTIEQAREEVRDRVIQERLYKELTKEIKISDRDIQAHYEKNKAQFTQPASRDVSHILVKKKAEADALYRQVQNGADFAALARRFSQDTSTKAAGGKLPVTKGSYAPRFEEAVFALETGEVSKPVKTQFGWHIIKALTAAKAERTTPLADVKDSIRSQLEQERKNKTVDDWLKSIEKKYEGETVYAAGFEPPKSETTATTTTTKR